MNIGWSDYRGAEGYEISDPNVAALTKALSAGSEINAPAAGPGVGFPLRVESLEGTLKNLTYRMEHLRLWKMIPKKGATNTTEEHNELQSYGDDNDGFIPEGGLPAESDSVYERKYVKIKYLGVRRGITHQMTLVRPAHGNVVGEQTVAGTMDLLRKVERGLFYGDSSLSDLQFDGFEKLIKDKANPRNIIDMRGQPLDEEVLQDGAMTISDDPNFGTPTHMHMNPKVKSDLIKTLYPKARHDTLNAGSGKLGLAVDGFVSVAGFVKFETNSFVRSHKAPPLAAAGGTADEPLPGTPTVSTAATTPVEAAALFTAEFVGAYEYSIVAHNNSGHSAPVTIGATAVALGDKVTFGITPAGANTLWYEVYRTKANGTDKSLILRVPNLVGAGETIMDDLNESLPFCSSAFMWQQDDTCLAWKQLAPFMKIPLGTTKLAMEWMQVVYGSPVLYAPNRAILYKNVGRAPNFVGEI